MKHERHKKHLQELEKQIESNRERRHLDQKTKREKVEGFWAGNEASAGSAFGNSKMA